MNSSHKVVIIGDAFTGKSTLLYQLVCNNFIEDYHPTVGTGYRKWKSNETTLHIWDTSGQEIYKSLNNFFYQKAEAAIIVCSRNERGSIRNVRYWLKQYTDIENDGYVVVSLNKSDLNCHTNDGDVENLIDWCQKKNIGCFETSAKNGMGVQLLFEDVAAALRKRDKFLRFDLHPGSCLTMKKCNKCC